MSESQIKSGPTATRSQFGTMPDGKVVQAYTLKNSHNMIVKILSYGGVINECWVPAQSDRTENVVLGFDKLDSYIAKHPRFGSTIGRYANRISNAQFELDGQTFKLQANKGSTTIHGGNVGFDKRVWDEVDHGQDEKSAWVNLRYLSPDMEEGFPGNLEVKLAFVLDENNSLIIKYAATTDRATPINLTNHSYFNLSGAGRGNILNHRAQFQAASYTPLNEDLVPTGELASVQDTPFDFRKETAIGARIEEAGGYDLNYVIGGSTGEFQLVGTVKDPSSGRVLTAHTDQPGFQFFTANSLDGSITGNGGKYERYAGFCIETQHFPDAVHHKNFPNTILRPNEKFSSVTQYSFSCQNPG